MDQGCYVPSETYGVRKAYLRTIGHGPVSATLNATDLRDIWGRTVSEARIVRDTIGNFYVAAADRLSRA